MKLLTIISASAFRIILCMLIAVILGIFLPVLISITYSILIEKVNFYDCTSSEIFIIACLIGIIIAMFWVGNKTNKYNTKNQ